MANEKKKTAGASSPDPEMRAEAASAGARSEEGTGDFPKPRPFDAEGGVAPLREEDRDEVTGVPFDEDGAFDYDADADEFLDDADSILDDDQRDYYRYGEKMHGVHKTAADLREDEAAARRAERMKAEGPAVVGAGEPAEEDDGDVASEASEPSRGGHAKPSKKEQFDGLPESVKRSHRMRRVLIIAIIVLVALAGAIGYFGYQMYVTSQTTAVQQTNETTSQTDQVAITDDANKDASTENVKQTDVPALVSLIGLTQDQAVTQLAHGATVTLTNNQSIEGNPVVTNVTVMLTEEPADAHSNTPTVYLGLDANGTVVQAGYTASTAELGYGSLSFKDAVENEHVVEKTLDDAGLTVADGTAQLPTDKDAYQTYASDGTTLVSERASFDGSASANGANYTWSAVLSYDYTAANATGNLANTIRQITVYVNAA